MLFHSSIGDWPGGGLKQKGSLLLTVSLILLFSAVLCVGLVNHLAVQRPMINDEAVELLQGTDMPVGKFYFFTPDFVYPEGYADIIETLVPYINRILSGGLFGIESQDQLTLAIRFYYLAAYVAGVFLFSLAVGRLWGGLWSVAGGVALGFSAFTLILNQILTRNGLSILWASTVFYLLVMWPDWRRAPDALRKYGVPCLLALVLILGCWTYTSFRLLAVALYAALLLDWFRSGRNTDALKLIVASLAFWGAGLAAMVTAGGNSFMLFLQRGGYALSKGFNYPDLFVVSLLSPLYHATGEKPFFLVEDIHNLVERPVLSSWLAPFFVLGWLTAWKWGGRFMYLVVLIYTLGMALCALAGPSAKYLFVFFPFTLTLSLWGLYYCFGWLKTGKGRKAFALGMVVLLGGMTAAELRDAFIRFPGHHTNIRNGVSERVSKTAMEQVNRKGKVYVHSSLGYDIVMWGTLPGRRAGKMSVYPDFTNVLEAWKTDPPPPGSVLVTDMKAEDLAREHNGWTAPPEVELVSTSSLK